MDDFDDKENVEIEIKLLLQAIYMKYGYDFTDYSFNHMERRVLHVTKVLGISISELQHQILYKKQMFEKLFQEFSINTTEMFRDPSFFKTMRESVIPILKTIPFIKIWHAGCSTGEEVYSMAILLKEEGLYERCQIYATDFNHSVIQKAKEGRYPIEKIKKYTMNYQQAGGKESFSDYYTADVNSATLHSSLKEKITFAQHNLVTDGVFGEMNVIICRNVIIYFNQQLQNRVLSLFCNSLSKESFLCLGSKESLRFTDLNDHFMEFVEKENIYQKMM